MQEAMAEVGKDMLVAAGEITKRVVAEHTGSAAQRNILADIVRVSFYNTCGPGYLIGFQKADKTRLYWDSEFQAKAVGKKSEIFSSEAFKRAGITVLKELDRRAAETLAFSYNAHLSGLQNSEAVEGVMRMDRDTDNVPNVPEVDVEVVDLSIVTEVLDSNQPLVPLFHCGEHSFWAFCSDSKLLCLQVGLFSRCGSNYVQKVQEGVSFGALPPRTPVHRNAGSVASDDD